MDETPDLRLLAHVAASLEEIRERLERLLARQEAIDKRIEEIKEERAEFAWQSFLRKHPELRDDA